LADLSCNFYLQAVRSTPSSAVTPSEDEHREGELGISLSFVVLKTDDVRPLGININASCAHRKVRAGSRSLGAIIAAHAALIWVVLSMPGETRPLAATAPLASVPIRPLDVVSHDSLTDPALPREIRARRGTPFAYEAPIPDIDRRTTVINGVGTVAPRPPERSVDVTPFVLQAGLVPGKGATVVLRVEGLGSGELGRVEIDVSLRTDPVDRAAIAYAFTDQHKPATA
jgi:hypothetical protein